MGDTVARERTPEQLKAIGQRLKLAREALGISQREICELLDVRPTTWNHWETGRRMPDPVVMAEMAIFHRVSLDWIYSGQQLGSQFTTEQLTAVGHRLRATRSALELHPQEMADTLGICLETLEEWESGKAFPNIEVMIFLANRFGISLDWIFRGDPSNLPHRIAGKTLGVAS